MTIETTLQRALDFIESLTADPLLMGDDIEMTLDDVQNHARMELASIRQLLAPVTKDTFSASDDTDTPLMAAAREAGWALMETVDEIAWEKRDQVANIIGRLGLALRGNPTHRQNDG